MVGGDPRDPSVDPLLFCGAAALGLARTADYEALQRQAFRASLEARFSVANLAFRGVRLIARARP
jgi:hypothetical protein